MQDTSSASGHKHAAGNIQPAAWWLTSARQPCACLALLQACDSELLEARGAQSKYRLDYRTRWHFWKVSGVCDSKLHMWTDMDAGTVSGGTAV